MKACLWPSVAAGALGVFLVSQGACQRERVGVIAGPPLTVAPASSTAFIGPQAPEAPGLATFVDLMKDGAPVQIRACEDLVAVVVNGEATALSETLSEHDILIVHGEGRFDFRGQGLAVLAAIRLPACTAEATHRTDSSALTHEVVRGGAAPSLSWSNGAMSANLDIEAARLPSAYVGRLRGTASVAEHAHDGSWEILCAIDGSGTFTLGGAPHRLEPRGVVMVPAGTKHSWTPDPGKTLSAIQLYIPPGPEQRFRVLAAGSSDGGLFNVPRAPSLRDGGWL